MTNVVLYCSCFLHIRYVYRCLFLVFVYCVIPVIGHMGVDFGRKNQELKLIEWYYYVNGY